MQNQDRSAPDPWRRSQIGALLGIALVTVSIVIALSVTRPRVTATYQVPPQTSDGWVTAPPGAVGMDEEPLQELLHRLAQQEGHYNIHSLLVVKGGKLVLEAYYPGFDITVNGQQTFAYKRFDRETQHCLASASKSVTSLLLGIALDQGRIGSVDEKLFDSFPEYAELASGYKGEISLRHMLTMTSGIPWDESYSYNDPRNDLGHMTFFSQDPVRYVLEKPLEARPGEVWVYNSGTTNLLGEIVHRRTGMTLADYARDNLFTPLGITSYEWIPFPQAPQMAIASSTLYLRPRDMARIGQLTLQQGQWDGRQIVSPQWVQDSLAMSVPLSLDYGPAFQNTGYGYQWWRGKFRNGDTTAIYAAGWGGQFILLLPRIDTVIVTTGSNYENDFVEVFELIDRYILGAVYSDY